MRITLLGGERGLAFQALRAYGDAGDDAITDIYIEPETFELNITYGGPDATTIADRQLWDVINEYWRHHEQAQ